MSKVGIQFLPSSASAATKLAGRLGVPIHEIVLHRFPDGELRVRVGLPTSTTIVYASLDQPNHKLISVLFAAEALRRGGAKRLVLVAPYLCYMRQDISFHDGEAISQSAIGRFLGGIFDRIVTVDAHLHRTKTIQDVFKGVEADNISAIPAIEEFLRAQTFDNRSVIIGPDVESKSWVVDLADRLGLAHAIADKIRHSDHSVEMRFADAKRLAGRPAIILDDIVSSGGTLFACANSVMAAGASFVDAIVTHALFPAKLVPEFQRHGIRTIRSTDSVSHATNEISLNKVIGGSLQRELVRGRE